MCSCILSVKGLCIVTSVQVTYEWSSTYIELRDQIRRQVVAYKSLKTVENYKIVSTKSGHGRLRKVIVYEK